MNRVLAVLAAGFLLCGAATDESPAQGPRIRVEPEGFDFGRTRPLQTLRKEFRLHNAGDRDLVLQEVRTSCGCTAAIVGKTTLAPGGSTPLSVSLRTGGGAGRIVKSVLVPSNDPKTPLLAIKIQATVEATSQK